MNVAIINPVGDAISEGYRKYLEQLIPRLANDQRVSNLLVIAPRAIELNRHLNGPRHVKIAIIPEGRWKYFCNMRKNQDIREFQPDVVFVPIPRQIRVSGIPIVTMIQNMEPIAFNGKGNPISEKIKNRLRAFETRQAIQNADRVIAISKFVRDFLVMKWRIPSKRTGQVYFGIDKPELSTVLTKPFKICSDLPARFLFTAGSIRPARGLEDALYAMGEIIKGGYGKFGLVIAGGVDSNMKRYDQRLKTIIEQLGLKNNILWAGLLCKQEMSWCYRHCEAFLMTSRVEACPNIVLEAMANGCVCISSETPPMPEFFEDAAVYYPPRIPKALAQRIRDVISWPQEKKHSMKQKAKTRAADFNWDQCSKQTVNEFQIAIDGFSKPR